MTTLRTIMAPVLDAVTRDLDAGRETHELCAQALVDACTGTVPVSSIPADVPVVWHAGAFKRLLVAQLQYTKLCVAVPGRGACNYTVAEPYRPRPVQVGILWGKPYCRIQPLAGVTAADWQQQYPPFHYSGRNANAYGGDICVGQGFAIGDASDPATELPRLVELLSWVNLTDSMLDILQAGIDYSAGPWPAWGAAVTKLTRGEPQDVFVEIPQLRCA